jgi:hypothetical protein
VGEVEDRNTEFVEEGTLEKLGEEVPIIPYVGQYSMWISFFLTRSVMK